MDVAEAADDALLRNAANYCFGYNGKNWTFAKTAITAAQLPKRPFVVLFSSIRQAEPDYVGLGHLIGTLKARHYHTRLH